MYWPIVPWNFIMALWFVNQVYLDVFKNTVGVVQKHKQPAADTETFTTESHSPRRANKQASDAETLL